MEIEQLKLKLIEIDNVIKSEYIKEELTGVLAGLSGISLFEFYYAKFLNKDEHATLGIKILEQCILKINEGSIYYTYCSGIAGMGWVVDHLTKEGFIEEDNDELLSELDNSIYKTMLFDFKNKNFDFLHGAIGYGLYFIQRYKCTKSFSLKMKYKEILIEFISELESYAIVDGNTVKWLFSLNGATKEANYNFGLSHGLASVIGILTKLHELDIFKSKTEKLIRGAINYIYAFKQNDSNSVCLFPNSVSTSGEPILPSRLAWCYGDLGIGVSLLNASEILEDEVLKNNAIAILKHSTKRLNVKENKVFDASICHGSFGNAQIFNNVYKKTKDPIFKTAANFWIQDGLKKATSSDGFAGFKQWHFAKNEWYSTLSLLEGVAGIGLCIIDHIAEFDSNWDECLMIS